MSGFFQLLDNLELRKLPDSLFRLGLKIREKTLDIFLTGFNICEKDSWRLIVTELFRFIFDSIKMKIF